MFCAVAGYSKSFKDLGCSTEHTNSQNIISSDSEWSDCVLSSLVAACGKRIIKEPHKGFPPVQRILKCSLQLSDGLAHIPETEIMDPVENRSENLSPFGKENFFSDLSCIKRVSEFSFLMEERCVEFQKLESRTTLAVSVGFDSLASGMHETSDYTKCKIQTDS